MAVRIRMTKLGRRHRPYFRIVAADSRSPRDGKYIEDLGSYDPMVANKDARLKLKASRIKHWLSVGAQPSKKVGLILKKHLEQFAKAEAEGTPPTPAAEAPPQTEETSDSA